jgi:hypothetical protein
MADREVTYRLFTKRRKAIKQHKDLRTDPRYNQKTEKSVAERKREWEDYEAEQEIEEYETSINH